MTKPFDLEAAKRGEPVQTRDGRSVRILAFDKRGETCPIVGLVNNGEVENLGTWTLKGEYIPDCFQRTLDLVMAPRKARKDVWINVYPGTESIHNSRESADKFAERARLACIPVTLEWEE